MMLADLDQIARAVLAPVADSAVRGFVLASVIGVAGVMLRRKGSPCG